MADIFGNIANVAKAGAEGLALVGSPGYRQGKQIQQREKTLNLDIETKKMENWLKIVNNQQFSRQLRESAARQVFNSKPFRILANSTGATQYLSPDFDVGNWLDSIDQNKYAATAYVDRFGQPRGGSVRTKSDYYEEPYQEPSVPEEKTGFWDRMWGKKPPAIEQSFPGVRMAHTPQPEFAGPPSPFTPVGTPRFPTVAPGKAPTKVPPPEYPDAVWSKEHQMWTVIRNGRLMGVE